MSYEIRPLRWLADDDDFSYVDTNMGSLSVRFARGEWLWRISSAISFHRARGIADSLEHGKQLAEAEYRRRLLPMLIEVKEATE